MGQRMRMWAAAGLRGAALRGAVLAAWLCVLASGCATDPLAGQRVAAYTPDVQAGDRMPWKSGESAAIEPGTLLPGEPGTYAATITDDGTGGGISGQSGDAASGPAQSPSRLLKRDDRVNIGLRAIPRPEEVAEVIDGDGNVNLPLIGLVNVEGLTTAEAERKIKAAYIDGGFYRNLTVIIVAQEDSYFVRGEVIRPGKYPLTGNTTLIMAITAAGGYTDYAKETKIKVIRGDEVNVLNATRMEDRDVEDFLIHAMDIIVVERRIFL